MSRMPCTQWTFGGTIVIPGFTSIVTPRVLVILLVSFPFQQRFIVLLAVIALVLGTIFGKRNHVVCRTRSAQAISTVHEDLRVSEGRSIL